MPQQDEVIYHGVYQRGGCVIEIEQAGKVTGVVAHVVKHSPTGLNWGYGGSGPADCARSLLIAALGDEATCPECNGTRQTTSYEDGGGTWGTRPYDPARDGDPPDPELTGPCWCEQGYRNLPYQAFKFDVIARLPQPPADWRMTRQSVVDWYRARQAEEAGLQ